jgi:DNA-binding beta-propeller fold protein YncE
MGQRSLRRGKASAIGIWVSMVALSLFLICNGSSNPARGAATGSPRLVSVQQLPETDGERCQWTPASASESLFSALPPEQEPEASADQRPTDAAKANAAQRKPARVLRDPSSAFAGVAVDLSHNEVVLTDENLFSLTTYDRLTNTPPRARMSEPKRSIRGAQTSIEFNCGIYVDPANGDIYTPNNDAFDNLVIFHRDANGDVPPARKLKAPHSTFGIAVDEQAQEMFVTVQDDHAVMVWKKSAKDQDLPVRVIQGSHTRMADPHGIALDPKTGVVIVSNWGTTNERPPFGSPSRGRPREWPVGLTEAVPSSGKILPPSITVYPKDSAGDTPPLRVIQGPQTQLNWPTALTVDSEHGELFVANDPADSVTVYSLNADGDAQPIRVLKGPKSLVKNPTGLFYDGRNQELWVSNFGNHSATVYKRTAAGDAPPLRVIRSAPLDAPAPMMGNPYNVGYDTKREEILVAS